MFSLKNKKTILKLKSVNFVITTATLKMLVINDVSYQISDFRRRLWSARVVEEEAGKLPVQVDGHGLLRADRVNTEVVENVPLANLQGDNKLKIKSFG